jgi:hypothetical protein
MMMRISDALAMDDRVGELGLQVHAEPGPTACGRIIVTGHVSTPARYDAVTVVAEEVVRDHGADCEVVNATEVSVVARPDGGGERV